MAEEWLEEVYENSRYISIIKDVVRLSREKNKFEALRIWRENCDYLKRIYEEDCFGEPLVRQKLEEIFSKVRGVKNIEQLEEFILKWVLPFMYYYVSLHGAIDVVDEENGYNYLSSKAGYLTMQNLKLGRMVHSIYDPMEEAMILADQIYSPKNTEYHLWGTGLGYLAYALYFKSKRSVTLFLYEENEVNFDIASKYGVIEWIAKEKLHMVADPFAKKFLDAISEDDMNYYVTRSGIDSSEIKTREVLNRVYLNCRFWVEERKKLDINYHYNTRKDMKLWNQIEARCDSMIVVAAGPSLDDSMEYLRSQKGKKYIIAVGTIFKKLIDQGIEPNLMVIMEDNELVYDQIAGYEKENTPMLLSLYSYWKLADAYQGPVYFAPISEMEQIKKFAKEHNMDVWKSGGTVSLMAIEAALHLGAKEVEFVGLDLAYPGDMTHATDTSRNTKINENERYIMVPSVNGEMVKTDAPFNMYRLEIEQMIKNHQEIAFYNLSKKGAMITGAKQTRLK